MKRHIQTITTPTGPLSVIRPVAEQLLASGVVSGALDGALHAADAAIVKAALMSVAGVCDFCSSPGASHSFDVPDFEMPGASGHMSTGGWAACDVCADHVRAGNRKALLDRSVAGLSFPKFSRAAIEELHARFWQGMADLAETVGTAAALADFVEDRIRDHSVAITDRDRRREAVVRMTGLSLAQVDRLVAGEIAGDKETIATLSAWSRRFGRTTDPRAVADLLSGLGPRKPLVGGVPHWQRALDARFQALGAISTMLAAGSRSEYFPESVDLHDAAAVRRLTEAAALRSSLRDLGYDEDVKLLKAAQAYSFNGETIAAIREAAQGIPQDAPLSSIETPNTGAGWFWFGEPMPVAASPVASGHTHALLWGWTDGYAGLREVTLTDALLDRMLPSDRDAMIALAAPGRIIAADDVVRVGDALKRAGVSRDEFERLSNAGTAREPAIAFSCYVLDERGETGIAPGTPIPSTRWYWPLSMSFREMLAFSAQKWDASYGPGSEFEGDAHLMGRDATVRVISELSLFFVMACLWFRQTVPVLTREPGHVERHARKRYVREHKLVDPPTVQVVALRKSQRVAVADAPADRQDGARAYKCRWIVKGHPRLQACGPGRKDRKLIWIEAHPAGPDDKPLRTREKVYAVVR